MSPVTVVWVLARAGRAPMTPDQGAVCLRAVDEDGAVDRETEWVYVVDPRHGFESFGVFSSGWSVRLGVDPGTVALTTSRTVPPADVEVVAGRVTFADLAAAPPRPERQLDPGEPIPTRQLVAVVLADLEVAAWDRIRVWCRRAHRPDWTTATTAAWTSLPPRCRPVLALRTLDGPELRLTPDEHGATRWALADHPPQ